MSPAVALGDLRSRPVVSTPWPTWAITMTPSQWQQLDREQPAVAMALRVLEAPACSISVATRADREAEQTQSLFGVCRGLAVHLGVVRRHSRAAIRLAAFDATRLGDEITGAVPQGRRGHGHGDGAADPGTRHTGRYPYLGFLAGLRAARLAPEVLSEVALDIHRCGGARVEQVSAQLLHLSRSGGGALSAVLRHSGRAVAITSWALTTSGWFALTPEAEWLEVRPVERDHLAATLLPLVTGMSA